jgi:hypothetical protein
MAGQLKIRAAGDDDRITGLFPSLRLPPHLGGGADLYGSATQTGQTRPRCRDERSGGHDHDVVTKILAGEQHLIETVKRIDIHRAPSACTAPHREAEMTQLTCRLVGIAQLDETCPAPFHPDCEQSAVLHADLKQGPIPQGVDEGGDRKGRVAGSRLSTDPVSSNDLLLETFSL